MHARISMLTNQHVVNLSFETNSAKTRPMEDQNCPLNSVTSGEKGVRQKQFTVPQLVTRSLVESVQEAVVMSGGGTIASMPMRTYARCDCPGSSGGRKPDCGKCSPCDCNGGARRAVVAQRRQDVHSRGGPVVATAAAASAASGYCRYCEPSSNCAVHLLA